MLERLTHAIFRIAFILALIVAALDLFVWRP